MRHPGQLEEWRWWPLERFERLQSLFLQRLIRHAYSSVPQYRRVGSELGLVPSDVRTMSHLSRHWF
jgi:phenylacetate-coenzyme A ligase PaaK-like adenylate-forming protein